MKRSVVARIGFSVPRLRLWEQVWSIISGLLPSCWPTQRCVNDMVTSPAIEEEIEIPRKFIYLSENFTLDNGTLTQTMKLKRRVVLEQYKDQIEDLYT